MKRFKDKLSQKYAIWYEYRRKEIERRIKTLKDAGLPISDTRATTMRKYGLPYEPLK